MGHNRGPSIKCLGGPHTDLNLSAGQMVRVKSKCIFIWTTTAANDYDSDRTGPDRRRTCTISARPPVCGVCKRRIIIIQKVEKRVRTHDQLKITFRPARQNIWMTCGGVLRSPKRKAKEASEKKRSSEKKNCKPLYVMCETKPSELSSVVCLSAAVARPNGIVAIA